MVRVARQIHAHRAARARVRAARVGQHVADVRGGVHRDIHRIEAAVPRVNEVVGGGVAGIGALRAWTAHEEQRSGHERETGGSDA